MKSLYDQASELPTKDLVRHARVSIDNRHYCDDCFCCAAFDVLGFRYPQLRQDIIFYNGRLDYRRLSAILNEIEREAK